MGKKGFWKKNILLVSLHRSQKWEGDHKVEVGFMPLHGWKSREGLCKSGPEGREYGGLGGTTERKRILAGGKGEGTKKGRQERPGCFKKHTGLLTGPFAMYSRGERGRW